MKKQWKEIEGSEGQYLISNQGEVFSCKTKKKLAQRTKNNGYLVVSLYMKGQHCSKTVHRLVAKAFLKRPSIMYEVNHKDGNKKNNNLENLEWVTRSENQLHALKTGLAPKPKQQKKYYHGRK